MVYSSPFYRCLQTLRPFVAKADDRLGEPGASTVNYEPGLGEWFGTAPFEHPQPASFVMLKEQHFPFLDNEIYAHCVAPNPRGESIAELHNRVARVLHNIIMFEDRRLHTSRSILICTHAAVMIAIGRVLTGRMPDDPNEEDFRCGTCSFSHYGRRRIFQPRKDWSGWENGVGVGGGWDVEVNGDCRHLPDGEERNW